MSSRCIAPLATFAHLAPALAIAVLLAVPAAAQETREGRALVPSVIDSTTERAVEMLRQAGIRVAHVESVASSAGGGRVLRQVPREGTVVPLPAAGTLWVAVARVQLDANVLLERARDRIVDVLEPALPQRVDTVPAVIGSPIEKAREAFNEVGIQVSAINRVEASEAPGIVVRQLPAAGTAVPSEGLGELWVSVGLPEPEPGYPVVPDVVGLPLERARLAFMESEVPLDDVRFAPSDEPDGTVIAQRPRAGTDWSPDLHGEVVVSTGPQAPVDVAVPGLVDRTTQEAFELLTEAGLRGDIAEFAESSLENDRVVDQAPAPGTMVPAGTVVGIVVSLGPPAPPVDTAGSRPTPPPPSPPDQDDQRGDPPGDEPPPLVPVTVPDLIGLSGDAAARVASALGFVLRPREVEADEAEPRTVMAQLPAPGEQVPEGTVIDVDVSSAAWAIPVWALPAAVVLVGLAGFVRRRRRKAGDKDEPAPATTPEPDAPAPTTAPPVTFRPRPGPMRQQVENGGPLIADLEVQLAPRLREPASVWVDGAPFQPFPGGEHE